MGGISSGEQKSPPLLETTWGMTGSRGSREPRIQVFLTCCFRAKKSPHQPFPPSGLWEPRGCFMGCLLSHAQHTSPHRALRLHRISNLCTEECLLPSPPISFLPSLSFSLQPPPSFTFFSCPSHPSGPPPPPRKWTGFVIKPGFVLRETGFHVSHWKGKR